MDLKVILIVCWLTISFSSEATGLLECYNCTDTGALCQCSGTTVCSDSDDVCFSTYTNGPNGRQYTLGCKNKNQCSHGASGIVGRAAQSSCSKCCDTSFCNRKLCQDADQTCADTDDFDCDTVGSTLNYCADPHRSKTYCRRFCGLCTLRDGGWTSWNAWSSCDVTCENGTQTRTRTCTNPAPKDCGDSCVGANTDVKTCSLSLCPVHGGWTAWAAWGGCSATCDSGLQRRDRSCSHPLPARGGDQCPGDSRDYRVCLMPGCHDGSWSSWHAWGTCSRSCGDGIRSRSRTCSNPKPSLTGSNCEGDSLEVGSCYQRQCTVKLSAFTAYGPHDVGSSTIIKFTTIVTNLGSDYSASTGRFTCQYPGLYLFTVSITKYRTADDTNNDTVGVYILVNGSRRVQAYIDPDDASDDGSYEATATLTVHLARGYYVDVGDGTHASRMSAWSQFSGVLILPD